MELKKTVERIVPKNFETREEYLLYLRHFFAYEKVLQFLEDDFRVLEIGFGEGYGTNLLADHLNRITALDVNKKAVDYANGKYGDDNCKFQHYNGNRLPYSDQHFDAVISFQVIEHIGDDHQFVKEIQRVLKKNGIAVITTPNRKTRLKPGEEPWNEFHVREYSANQLQKLLSGYFDDVTIMGVRAEPDVERIESNRVSRSLSLYKLLPNFLKRYTTEDYIEEYDTDSFYLKEDKVNKSMDLFAIARRV
jgi:ubiquinone/menaquinone biosynthesis C-methylase UbiE